MSDKSKEKPINLRGLSTYDKLIKGEITNLINDDTTSSPNVTWSSEKILKMLNTKIDKIHQLEYNANLDLVIDSGMYRMDKAYTNGPEGDDNYEYGWGQMLVIHGGVDTLAQLLFPFNETKMVFRTGNPLPLTNVDTGEVTIGSWNEWETVATASDLTKYLSLEGGTLTGELKIEGVNTDLTLMNMESGRTARLQSNAQEMAAILYNWTTDFNYSALVLRPETHDLTTRLQLNTRSGDETTSYNVYHEGNLPSALRADDNGAVYAISANADNEEMQTFALFHEGNPPTVDVVGAASAEDHNIRTYTALGQIGLTNDDMSADDFIANIKAINMALGDGDVILYLTKSNSDNLHTSIINKLNNDMGKNLDGSATLSIKISRTGDVYSAITTDVVYNTMDEAMYIYSCIYNKEESESDDTFSNFVITTHPDGFLPMSGGNVTGDVSINGEKVYYPGNKPTPAEIGAANASHRHSADDLDIASSTNELNYLAGVTGNIQEQLDSKEPVGAASTALSSAIDFTNTSVNNHNTATDAHNDIRLLISEVLTQLENFLDVDDTTRDQLSEVLALIDENADSIEAITSSKVNVTDIINNLTTNVSNKPLSAAQGVALKGLIDALTNVVNSKSDSDHTHNYAGSSSAGGSATSAVKLATARDLQVDLGNTSAVSFDGTKSVTLGVNGVLPVTNGGTGVYQMPKIYVDLNNTSTVDLFQNVVTPGVSGTLSIEHGGTGATTASDARIALGITPVNINAADRAHSHAVSDVEGLQEVIEELAPSQLLKIIDLPLMTATEGQTKFTIELEEFDINYDSIQVQKGNLLLFPTQYTVSGNTLTLTEGVESGVTIGIRVYRTIEVENRGDSSEPGQSGSVSVTLGTNLPYAPGTASAGIATTVSRSDHVHPLQTTVSGNAGSATKLATSRIITLTGDVTGSVSFDGSKDVSITTNVADDSHNHVISNIDGLQSALDGKADSSHGTHVTYGTAKPASAGTASAGSASTVSRSDHVHPLQTTVSGNAGSATKLATSRIITLTGDVTGSVSFDGSGDVSITTTIADDSHNHVISNIDGLQSALDGKAGSEHSHNYLPINPGSNYPLTTNLYFNNKQGRIMGTQHVAQLDALNGSDLSKYTSLMVWNPDSIENGSMGLSGIVMVRRTHSNGTYDEYNMYGTHNITKGTTDLTTGTSPLANDAIYLVYE